MFMYFIFYLFLCINYWSSCLFPFVVRWQVPSEEYDVHFLFFGEIKEWVEKLGRGVTIFAAIKLSLRMWVFGEAIFGVAADWVVAVDGWVKCVIDVQVYVANLHQIYSRFGLDLEGAGLDIGRCQIKNVVGRVGVVAEDTIKLHIYIVFELCGVTKRWTGFPRTDAIGDKIGDSQRSDFLSHSLA